MQTYSEKKRLPKKNKLVIVEWIDSGLCDPSWIEASSYEKKSMPICYTVGWLYKKTKDKTILFSSYSLDDGSYKEGNEGTIQIIYNKCILEVKECQIDTP